MEMTSALQLVSRSSENLQEKADMLLGAIGEIFRNTKTTKEDEGDQFVPSVVFSIIYQNKTERRLIREEDGELKYESKPINGMKANSLHLLILKALLHYEQKGEDAITFRKIDNYLVKNGKRKLKGRKAIRKRILDGYREIFRFLDIPRHYGILEIIEVVPGKGLKFNNPKVLI